jgi:hypothetical protein
MWKSGVEDTGANLKLKSGEKKAEPWDHEGQISDKNYSYINSPTNSVLFKLAWLCFYHLLMSPTTLHGVTKHLVPTYILFLNNK